MISLKLFVLLAAVHSVYSQVVLTQSEQSVTVSPGGSYKLISFFRQLLLPSAGSVAAATPLASHAISPTPSAFSYHLAAPASPPTGKRTVFKPQANAHQFQCIILTEGKQSGSVRSIHLSLQSANLTPKSTPAAKAVSSSNSLDTAIFSHKTWLIASVLVAAAGLQQVRGASQFSLQQSLTRYSLQLSPSPRLCRPQTPYVK
ncbi:hypothetical protein QQF64_024945 [Cirrhinus molitorella]|uniref:Uncharacterized protein n=1 Tax=Cirrhinus molitorella TaxID=172907 RepID=A0ABR3NN02_9TELE